jgi:hypothetical protein
VADTNNLPVPAELGRLLGAEVGRLLEIEVGRLLKIEEAAREVVREWEAGRITTKPVLEGVNDSHLLLLRDALGPDPEPS